MANQFYSEHYSDELQSLPASGLRPAASKLRSNVIRASTYKFVSESVTPGANALFWLFDIPSNARIISASWFGSNAPSPNWDGGIGVYKRNQANELAFIYWMELGLDFTSGDQAISISTASKAEELWIRSSVYASDPQEMWTFAFLILTGSTTDSTFQFGFEAEYTLPD